MIDKYGVGQDPYCYPETSVLRNRLGLMNEDALNEAERALSEVAASEIEFDLPPYDLAYLQRIHRKLFGDVYEWAGEIRSVDISKGGTHFCTVARLEAEATKIFSRMSEANWFESVGRSELVVSVAGVYGDLNMIHPFRDGNGRALRTLFEHIIVNAGYEISWWSVEPGEWLQANIDAVVCDYEGLVCIFDRCIGLPIG
ncbi:Fic/DOC family protein [Pseudomonas indica]|uniref:Fic/DOC family protein n=1 Tax=Pseudomonas indica TaxID=137658 RepID=UPI0023F6C742|nr:Fic family protein [Pseudomonas indica]MBU3059536.1 Fic family protein [Pseudomonas indica]